MAKLKCLTRYAMPVSETVLRFKHGDEAVVLILDIQKAKAAALEQWRRWGEGPTRLGEVRQILQDSGVLYIPTVHSLKVEEMEFGDGRHRTLALFEMGRLSLPVLTSRAHAERLRSKWGSIATANREYDFPDTDVTVMLGRS